MTAENHRRRLRRLDRCQILANHLLHESFLRFASQRPDHGAWVGTYVFMPDHVHAFVAIDDTKLNLSASGKSFKNSISKTLRQNGVAPPDREKTFFDDLLRSEDFYTQKWHYVRGQFRTSTTCTQVGDWRFQGEIFPLEYHSE